MSKPGPAFYDDDAVFSVYMTSRERPDNPNDTLEQPVLRELCGDLHGLRILDLGCGAASFGDYALANRCCSYLGVDGSRNMVAAARQALAGKASEIVQATIDDWDHPSAAFDLVVSSLALHYLADVDGVFAKVFGSLTPGGRFVFSVEHPVITSSYRGWDGGPRGGWLVDDYFEVGPRESDWLGGRVVKHHRTVEGYFASLQHAGFTVDSVRESHPQLERFADEAEYIRRLRIPLFLFLRGHKPALPD